ncbi:hypothetical protein [Lysobacter enzymogenes]|uniref:hypothetical protein n=1 Tax=Lysobacter enzymogenes TaxID=69 RepID=UPI0009CA481A|nr:hypothetical protein [Lysobacter enzymogenes]UZW61977.1 hypothetical protein BV903_006670 [Lysobacter enzymogenes]
MKAALKTVAFVGAFAGLIAGLFLAFGPAGAVAPAAPDLPLRVSPWLEQAMDSKTCPLVDVRVDAAGQAGRAANAPSARVATVWLAREDDAADPSAWPALYLSLGGRPLALRREGAATDVEAQSLRDRRGPALRWSAPAERVSARLLLQAPRLYVETGEGWRPVPPGRAAQARQGEDPTRTVWKGRLSLDLRGRRWEREVEVVSICGP